MRGKTRRQSNLASSLNEFFTKERVVGAEKMSRSAGMTKPDSLSLGGPWPPRPCSGLGRVGSGEPSNLFLSRPQRNVGERVLVPKAPSF